MIFKFSIFVVLIGFVVAANPQSDVTCKVIPKNNAFIYHLSRPSPSECRTGWETANRTVIARNHKSFPVVQNLSDESLTLNYCEPILVYTVACDDKITNLRVRDEKVSCEFDCSRFLDPKDNLTRTGNSTICITETLCLPKAHFVGIICGICIVLVILLFVVLGCYRWSRRECGTKRVLYTKASNMKPATVDIV